MVLNFFPSRWPDDISQLYETQPSGEAFKKSVCIFSLEITSLHEKVCVTFLLIPAPLSPLYILKVSLDP